ncbi:Alpha/Beta hydrolase protein [Corynascus novoguineensis]|uniref:Alpha/Beta hydrolase protein n=1 Tax=Corynascus novoguineensis TaxID=1126955 RepID=A0AAN7CPC8_9PEZI|nr:Alpha/Beta hydrolase protein [Corynascus novoguineensis]
MSTIQAARLLSRRSHVLPGQLHVTELFFEVPKNYARPDAGTLKLFGRSVRKHERPIVPLSASDLASRDKLPYLIYLQGGPGFGNREPQNMALTQTALSRGYQVLYLDYRGTGLSTPINADHVLAQGDPVQQAEYLKLFRANSIVRDLEAVRLCLTQDFEEEKKAWSIFGQSFGGFVGLTYLSKYPHGLREVFLTGGLAPVKRTADDVYRATYKKLIERNEAYYRKYPEDIAVVRRLAEYIQQKGEIPLPSGGKLSVQLFLTLGLAFGGHGGLDDIHSLVLRLATDLDQFNFFTRASLAAFESHISFDTNPIYAILHEAIYNTKQRGALPSNWAADRIGRGFRSFSWLADPVDFLKSTLPSEPLYFSGEMVYPFYFQGATGPELARTAAAADILAKTEEWDEDLYDEDQLRRNEVPVYAVSYIDDMYVDFELARETAALVKRIKVHETNGWYHDAVRSKSEEVFTALFKMRDDCID